MNRLNLLLTETGSGRAFQAAFMDARTRSLGCFDIACLWPRIEPHLDTKAVREALRRDFNAFTRDMYNKPFKEGKVPLDYHPIDPLRRRQLKRHPFLKYVRVGACRHLVNFQLRLAQAVFPDRAWRIMAGPMHSTVWDGDHVFFDLLSYAQQIPPSQIYAMGGGERHDLPVGSEAEVGRLIMKPEVEALVKLNLWVYHWL